jgi:hypothetical protein
VAAIVRGGGQAWALQGDFSKPAEITRTFAEIGQLIQAAGGVTI